MKNIITLFFSSMILIGSSHAQCNKELSDLAIGKLKDNYTFQKEIKIKLKKDKKSKVPQKIVQSLVLTAGQNYMFYAQNSKDNNSKVIYELFMGKGILGRSYLNGRHYKGIAFMCMKTGTYNLAYYYEKGEPGCSVIVVSSTKF